MRKLIFNKVSKEAISNLRKVEYEGRIFVIISPKEAERAVDFLLSQPILGFDTETRPAFRKGDSFKCSLLQVAAPGCCFLFRLNHIGLCPAIIRLLEDKMVTKVGLAWSNDLLSLRKLGSFKTGTFIDIQDMVKEFGIEDQSLVKIYANLFGQRISKTDRLSNWERDVLKDSQKAYAAIDAWACIRIYEELTRLKATNDYELQIVPEDKPTDNNEASIS